MKEKKEIRLPEGWDEMLHDQKVCWFIENYGTDEDDEEGNLIFDTEVMSEEVHEAYEEVIVKTRKAKKKGMILY
ncbi:MAG: hypothetical protein IJM15_01235 [Erysipelotrichaceae bacterium]|nr:hypothetical protein [Erysipelotrichaceae bacterium]